MRVIAVDVGESKLNYCRSLGAEFCVDAVAPNLTEQINCYNEWWKPWGIVPCYLSNRI